jgi:hypothetical protein
MYIPYRHNYKMSIFISETNETYETRQTSSVGRQCAQKHWEKRMKTDWVTQCTILLNQEQLGKLIYQHVGINPKHYTVST